MGNGQAVQQRPEVTLAITMGPQGIKVTGPLHDKMLCYALLEIGRDSVKDYVAPAEPAIQVVERAPLVVPEVREVRLPVSSEQS